jgi:CHAT domain-containing protein
MPKFSLIIFSSALLFSCASNDKTEPEQCPVEPSSIPSKNNLERVLIPEPTKNTTIKQVRQALFSTQLDSLHTDNVKLGESYRLQKRLGKLLAQQGDLVSASNAYQSAVQHLKQLRQMADIDKPSQDDLKMVHYGLADILLQRAQVAHGDDKQELLEQVIETLELLKQAELQNYFQDDCLISDESRLDEKLISDVNEERLNLKKLKKLNKTVQTAILYPIVFPKDIPNRSVELLLIKFSPVGQSPKSPLQKKIIWRKADHSEGDVEKVTNCFRDVLELPERVMKSKKDFKCKAVKELLNKKQDSKQNKKPDDFNKYVKKYGEILYQLIAKPVEDDLKGIETLVFVPDDILRSVPMTAFFDGREFVLEKEYAVVTVPGLSLTKAVSEPLTKNPRILLGGMSTKVCVNQKSEKKECFSKLSQTKEALESIAALFPEQSKIRQDEDFLIDHLKMDMRDASEPYTMIHLHTHGTFATEKENTFLLTYNTKLDDKDRLTMERLEGIFGLARLRQYPIELLTLSACETAKGDSQAALGLAGIAFKSGARSVIATLWKVDEVRTTEFMRRFYEKLKTSSSNSSKAQALQKAQQEMLKLHFPHSQTKNYEKDCDLKKDFFRDEETKKIIWCHRQTESPPMMWANYWAPFILIGNWFAYQ